MANISYYSTTLQGWMDPVFYQGDQGSCGPSAVVNAIGMISNMYGDHFSVNAQILYNMSLITEKALGTDFGVYPNHFMELLKNVGVTQNTDMQYGLSHIGETPSAADYSDAKQHTITSYTKIDLGTQETTLAQELSSYLLQGKAIFQAFTANYNFMVESGPLSTQPGDDSGGAVGGHFVQIVGVDTHTNMLTVASWGTQYGDHGLYHISLDNFYADKGGSIFNIDKLFVVNGFNGHDMTWDANTKEVASAYVGILDRAPDAGGFNYWVNSVKNGVDMTGLCNSMIESAEYKKSHVGETNTQFVESLYHNVLNRDADTGGLAYWVNALNAGVSKGSIAAGMIIDVSQNNNWAYDTYIAGDIPGHPKSGDPNMYMESLLFNNKLIAAQDYAIAIQGDSVHLDVAHHVIDNVTADRGSIWGVALVGVNDMLGRGHIDGIHTT